MSAIIILAITLPVISLYRSIAKNAAYQKAIDSISPSWNVSINII